MSSWIPNWSAGVLMRQISKFGVTVILLYSGWMKNSRDFDLNWSVSWIRRLSFWIIIFRVHESWLTLMNGEIIQTRNTLKYIFTESFPEQQWAAVNMKFRWITVPPHEYDKSLSFLKNWSRTIHSQESRTVNPFTIREFFDLRVFEFWSIEQNSRS